MINGKSNRRNCNSDLTSSKNGRISKERIKTAVDSKTSTTHSHHLRIDRSKRSKRISKSDILICSNICNEIFLYLFFSSFICKRKGTDQNKNQKNTYNLFHSAFSLLSLLSIRSFMKSLILLDIPDGTLVTTSRREET